MNAANGFSGHVHLARSCTRTARNHEVSRIRGRLPTSHCRKATESGCLPSGPAEPPDGYRPNRRTGQILRERRAQTSFVSRYLKPHCEALTALRNSFRLKAASFFKRWQNSSSNALRTAIPSVRHRAAISPQLRELCALESAQCNERDRGGNANKPRAFHKTA